MSPNRLLALGLEGGHYWRDVSPPFPPTSPLAQSIATCFEAKADAQALRDTLPALQVRPEEEAQLACSLLKLQLARLGDEVERTRLQSTAARLLEWYRSGEGARLSQATPELAALWVEAAATLASFEARRFSLALKDCWAARDDLAALEMAIGGLSPDGDARVEFARCLFHLRLAKLGRAASRAEFASRTAVLTRAWTNPEQLAAWLGPDEGLRALWEVLTPMLQAFFAQNPPEPTPTAEEPSAAAPAPTPAAPPQDEHVTLAVAPVERVPDLAGLKAPRRTPPLQRDRATRRPTEPGTDPARPALERPDAFAAAPTAPVFDAARPARPSRPVAASPDTVPTPAPLPPPPASAPRPVGGDGLFTADLLSAAMASPPQPAPRGRDTPTQPTAEPATTRDARAVPPRRPLSDTWPQDVQDTLDNLSDSPPPRRADGTRPSAPAARTAGQDTRRGAASAPPPAPQPPASAEDSAFEADWSRAVGEPSGVQGEAPRAAPRQPVETQPLAVAPATLPRTSPTVVGALRGGPLDVTGPATTPSMEPAQTPPASAPRAGPAESAAPQGGEPDAQWTAAATAALDATWPATTPTAGEPAPAPLATTGPSAFPDAEERTPIGTPGPGARRPLDDARFALPVDELALTPPAGLTPPHELPPAPLDTTWPAAPPDVDALAHTPPAGTSRPDELPSVSLDDTWPPARAHAEALEHTPPAGTSRPDELSPASLDDTWPPARAHAEALEHTPPAGTTPPRELPSAPLDTTWPAAPPDVDSLAHTPPAGTSRPDELPAAAPPDVDVLLHTPPAGTTRPDELPSAPVDTTWPAALPDVDVLLHTPPAGTTRPDELPSAPHDTTWPAAPPDVDSLAHTPPSGTSRPDELPSAPLDTTWPAAPPDVDVLLHTPPAGTTRPDELPSAPHDATWPAAPRPVGPALRAPTPFTDDLERTPSAGTPAATPTPEPAWPAARATPPAPPDDTWPPAAPAPEPIDAALEFESGEAPLAGGAYQGSSPTLHGEPPPPDSEAWHESPRPRPPPEAFLEAEVVTRTPPDGSPVLDIEVTADDSTPFGSPQLDADLIDAAVDALATTATSESPLLTDEVTLEAEAPAPAPVAAPPPPPPEEEAEVVEAVELAPPTIAPVARPSGPPPPPQMTPTHGLPRASPQPPSRPSRPPQRVSLDVELTDYEPDVPTMAFWQHTIKVLDLLPVPGVQRVARRLLPAETKEERQNLTAFVQSIDAAMHIPDARAFACLLELTCAGQQKEKGLFGKVNEQRKEAFARAFRHLAPTPEAAARAVAWFDFDGPMTEAELWQGLEVLMNFLAWCGREQKSPVDPQAQAAYLGLPPA